MRLAYAAASPFARKPYILLQELDLLGTVEIYQPGKVSPVSANNELNKINPLGMIPVLAVNDNQGIYDSSVICEYINHLGNGHFYPSDPEARFRSLQLQALADGIMDISVAMRYETALRPEPLRWKDWIDEQTIRVNQGLIALEHQCADFDPVFTIGEVAVVAALGYRDFRFADQDWRASCPALSAWYEQISTRPSVLSSVPE